MCTCMLMVADALSELAAQTDVFAKTHSIPVAMSKAMHDPLSPPAIHSSSYSSIVSNTGKGVGDHQLPPSVMSMASRPGAEGPLAPGGSNSENMVINSCQSSGLITMSGEFNVPSRTLSCYSNFVDCSCDSIMTDDWDVTPKLMP